MTTRNSLGALGVLVLLGWGLLQNPAQGELQFDEGMWRLELSGGTAYHSGRRSRSGDLQLIGEVEYEVPAAERCTLGLRLLPLFVYDQDDADEDTVWGGGVGLAARYYQVPGEYRGWFGELGAAVLGHSGNINGNDANFNFMLGAGVGYQFKNNWHAALKVNHISNAGLSDDNAGANTVNLAVGYRF
ncbi:MAG: acyloxyacyl hydrolase [Candidatus Hydrogenedentes bacterium]|nr:acyloxyacyl hydrolase [Candidatus Hydrogenedentota bacterium]